MEEVTIIDYEPALGHYFKSLNVEWIAHYFMVEAHDLEQLEHPEKILQHGGHILFAQYQKMML